MHDAENGILCAPVRTVHRGTNLWRPVRVSGTNNSRKSALLASILLLEEAHVARERALLYTSSFEDMLRLAARFTLTVTFEAHGTQPRAVPDTLCSAPALERRAVGGFDVSFDVSISQLPRIAKLIQRVGRCNRSNHRGEAILARRAALGSDARADEAKVSVVVRLVKKIELRRLAKIERQLRLALRCLIERSRFQPSTDYFTPSRGESAFRLPLTGARTPTAPPAAA